MTEAEESEIMDCVIALNRLARISSEMNKILCTPEQPETKIIPFPARDNPERQKVCKGVHHDD